MMKADPFKLVGNNVKGKEHDYVVLEYIEAGGMGAVYKAKSLTESKEVCIKFLRPDLIIAPGQYLNLFNREIQLAQKVSHPNLVKLLDSGQDSNGIPFIVMELLKGITLEKRIAGTALSKEECHHIFEQICKAVDATHKGKVLHLDLKPSNVFLVDTESELPDVKVIDFGLGKVIKKIEESTTLTQVRGTPYYCSPEHFSYRVSALSDIYSLGAILYVMITGLMPFGSSYVFAKQRPYMELPPLPSICTNRKDWSPAIDKVIIKALEREPSLRQTSAVNLLSEFKQASDSRSYIPNYHCYYDIAGYQFDPETHLLITTEALSVRRHVDPELPAEPPRIFEEKQLQLTAEEGVVLAELVKSPGKYIPHKELIRHLFLTQGIEKTGSANNLNTVIISIAKGLQKKAGKQFADERMWQEAIDISMNFLAIRAEVRRLPKNRKKVKEAALLPETES